MYIKRTLILSSLNDENKKILAFVQKGDGEPYVSINLPKDNNILFAIMCYANSPIEVALLNYNENGYKGDLPNYFDCSEIIHIAIAKLVIDKIELCYLGGGKDGENIFYGDIIKNLSYYNDKCLSLCNMLGKEMKESENKDKITAKNTENQCESDGDVRNVDLFTLPSEDEVKDIITDSLLAECLNQKDKCENCLYKNTFYEKGQDSQCDLIETVSGGTNLQNEIKNEDVTINGDENNIQFFMQVKNSINALFGAYPEDDILQRLIENSNFVKVDYEDTGDYYSVGYISENDIPKYICYAIPCKPNSPPPKDMEEFSQYLQVDENLAYYLMYQKASDGETIKVNVI